MFSTGNSSVDLGDILDKVSEFDILAFYLGITTIPCVINSPLRVDNNPSFGLTSTNGITIHYKDFSTQESGGTFDLLQKLFNLDFYSTLSKVHDDLPNIKSSDIRINIVKDSKTLSKIKYSSNVDLQCRSRNWESWDIEYWEQYGISLKWLKFAQIYPISHIIICIKGVQTFISAEKYAYAFVEYKDDKASLKIYQPFSKLYKWRNKHDSSVWDLWEQLPKTGDKLIITSSRKDALCIWENTGIPACSLQAESYLPKHHVVDILKSRFNNVYVLYDNDFTKVVNYGEQFGEQMSKEFGLIKLELPTELEAKDTSDLCKLYGRKKVYEVISELIKNQENN